MNGEHISRALNHLPDEMIQEAIKSQKTIPWRRIAAVAAALTIIITTLLWPSGDSTLDNPVEAQGVLKVYACEMDEADTENLKALELPSNKFFLKGIYSPFISATKYALPISLYIEDSYFENSKITFGVSSLYPSFCEKTTLANGDTLCLDYVPPEILTDIGQEGSFYLDIIIFSDENIVGYGIISFCFSGTVYYAYRFDTVCFPYIDKKPQNITMEYVQQRIAEYKESQIYGEGVKYVNSIIEEANQSR